MSARNKERAKGKKENSSEQDDRRSVEEDETREVVRETVSSASRRKPVPPQQTLPKIPEEVDDFLRNFLRRTAMRRTLCSFETEWYSSAQEGQRRFFFIPDAGTHKALLESELQSVHRQTEELRQEVLDAGKSLMTVQRQREFHCLQHRQVTENKKRLLEELKQLRKHLQSCESVLRQLDKKYDEALRNHVLITCKNARAQKEVNKTKNKPERSIKTSDGTEKASAAGSRSRRPKPSQLSTCKTLGTSHLTRVNVEKWKNPDSLQSSFSNRAHELPISCIDLHPRKWILASASDDHSWRLWELPAKGEKVGLPASVL